MIDRELAKEIKKANGDGGREAKFAFLNQVRAVCKTCSTPNVRQVFDGCFKEYGRAAVAVCVAATIIARADRLDPCNVRWARDVLQYWTNRPAHLDTIVIDDNLHPSRIEEYAGAFIKLTTE